MATGVSAVRLPAGLSSAGSGDNFACLNFCAPADCRPTRVPQHMHIPSSLTSLILVNHVQNALELPLYKILSCVMISASAAAVSNA